MRNPEFSHSEEALKEEAWKILTRETDAHGLVDVLICDTGIKHPDRVREMREYVRDEVLQEIASSSISSPSFCGSRNFRVSVYKNKISDIRRQGVPPFVDVTDRDAKRTDTPGQGVRHFRAINQRSIEVGDFLPHLEAVDELSSIIQKVKDPKHRQRFEIMLKGVGLGWSNREILDEWGNIEGKRLSDARISQTYLLLRDKYLRRKFPNIPHSFGDFRALLHPTGREMVAKKTQNVSEYRMLLSKELTRLLNEEQTPETKQEILVIEYLLGRRPYKDLVSGGLSTTRKVMLVKEWISAHSSVPFQHLKFSVLNGRGKHI